MRLHIWGYNSVALTEMVDEDSSTGRHLDQVANVVKVLGMTWEPNQDSLTFSAYHVVEFTHDRGERKHLVLQAMARLHDSPGFWIPVTIRCEGQGLVPGDLEM